MGNYYGSDVDHCESPLFDSSHRIAEAARYNRRTLAADIGAFRQIGEIVKYPSGFIETIPAAPPIEIILRECIDRTGGNALAAFLTGFEQASLFGPNQRMIPQFNLTDKAAQTARAPDRGDQQMIDAKPPKIQQMGQVLVGPARHKLVFVEIVGGRRQARFIAIFQ